MILSAPQGAKTKIGLQPFQNHSFTCSTPGHTRVLMAIFGWRPDDRSGILRRARCRMISDGRMVEPLNPSESPGVPTGTTAPADIIFDTAKLLSSMDNDMELIRHLAGIFTRQAPELLEQIRDAVRRKDAPALCDATHKLFGSVSNFRAGPATAAVRRLEEIGQHGDFSPAVAAIADLERELARFGTALTAFLAKT
jgi:HPt (histidine-containing phosphotransfer) domain-containing protein